MQSWTARCIVCGRELGPGDDPVVCASCPRPPVDARTLPPGEPPLATAPVAAPGRLAGMAARPRARRDELAVWETVGFGFAAAVTATLVWFQLTMTATAPLDFLAVPAGLLVGAAFRFDAAHRVRALYASLSGLLALAVAISVTYLHRRWNLDRIADVPVILPADEAFDLVWSAIEARPLVLVWWLIAVTLALRLPAVR